MEGKENETYLKLKLAEKEREVELAQSKIKDLQLRLIRYLGAAYRNGYAESLL